MKTEERTMIDHSMSVGAAVRLQAQRAPDRAALVFAPRSGHRVTVTYAEFEALTNRVAHCLAKRGVGGSSTVVVGLPNSAEFLAAVFGAWKVGAMTLPVRYDVPAPEREAILGLVQPTAVIANWTDAERDTVSAAGLMASQARETDAAPRDVTPCPGKAIGSGGSTGRPKIIIDPRPLRLDPDAPLAEDVVEAIGFDRSHVQLVAAGLYHNAPFSLATMGLTYGQTIVLMERFDAEQLLDLIAEHRVQAMFLAPTMMQRVLRSTGVAHADLSSLQSVYHAGAVCPAWVKRGWIDLIGATKVREVFGATEAIGETWIRGDEWLQHPGSVGKPRTCEVKILDEGGKELPAGQVGQIWAKRRDGGTPSGYRGAAPLSATADGFLTVGDMGWLDADGYLFIADRRIDMIISGGANVFPAEVEGALTEHPAVGDVAVIGLPDEEWGRRVHAVIELRPGFAAPPKGELDRFCRERLTAYKAPKTWEFVSELPRNGAGKIRRSELAADRGA